MLSNGAWDSRKMVAGKKLKKSYDRNTRGLRGGPGCLAACLSACLSPSAGRFLTHTNNVICEPRHNKCVVGGSIINFNSSWVLCIHLHWGLKENFAFSPPPPLYVSSGGDFSWQ